MKQGQTASAKWCFTHRVELASLIGVVGFFFFPWFPQSLLRLTADLLSSRPEGLIRLGYVLLAILNLLASALRIWAGGTLGGARMMAVQVQTNAMITAGPYSRVRNPIYLADILTLAGMGLVVPPPGSLVVWLLLVYVYPRIMSYEEESLGRALGEPYLEYQRRVARLDWSFRPLVPPTTGVFSWREGLLNNFIYLPLVPGFLVCALTGVLWHGVLVGAAGPLGWVGLHFWRNFKKDGLTRDGRKQTD
ncbi:MAG: isoprenylcysteine carboxylmethyltransferase family protein [Myxococcales bacterium]|nr:isoprenylcysteine carboxylmethyltransferase family protein [Myxococcales bacterium]